MGNKPYLKQSVFLRRDSRPIPDSPKEVRLFVVVRNEILRLPYFFQYYRKLGVDRFFVVDNASTDGTSLFLSSQKNTHIFKTAQPYGKSGCGHQWLLSLLDKYGRDRWCLAVDADELFYYPHCEQISIKKLCHFLDRNDYNAVLSFFIDMYPKKPLYLAHYKRGKDFLSVARYFDRDIPRVLGTLRFFGGMRKRVFNTFPNLRKFIFFKYTKPVYLVQGCHYIVNVRLATSISGCVLHFKYFSDFIAKAKEEALREQHWENAKLYKKYAAVFKKNPKLSLYFSGSKKFKNSDQLIRLGFMTASREFESEAKKIISKRKENIRHFPY